MQIRWFVFLVLPLGLAACGHSKPDASTLSLTCDGGLVLAGATSLQMQPASGGTALSYPDPANPGQTGSMIMAPGHACSVAPVVPVKPEKDGG